MSLNNVVDLCSRFQKGTPMNNQAQTLSTQPQPGVVRSSPFQSEQINELASALSKAQGEFPVVGKNKEVEVKTRDGGKYTYSYADLADIIETVKPILAKHGLSHTQEMRSDESGNLWLWTTLMHSSGQWRSGNFPLTICQRPQDTGSAITYARRYALSAALGIQAEEDDDGQQAQSATPTKAPFKPAMIGAASVSTGGKPSDAQLKRLFAITKSCQLTPEFVKSYIFEQWGIESSKDLSYDQYDRLCDGLQSGEINNKPKQDAEIPDNLFEDPRYVK